MLFYVGTFAGAGGRGLYTCRLRGDSLSIVDTTDALSNPNYAIRSRDGSALFAVGADASSGGAVARFDLPGGIPRLVSTASTNGLDPCHLTLSADERFLYVANYMGDGLCVLSVESGGLTGPIETLLHKGHGTDATRQERPHPHQVLFSPGDPQLLLCVDLGLDGVVHYRQDESTGRLAWDHFLSIGGGRGPRHLDFAKNGEVAYLVHEMASEISLLLLIAGRYVCAQTLSTLPESFVSGNTCAAVRVSPCGTRVCASNRGHDSIALFSINPDDTLNPSGWIPSGGQCPRDVQWIGEEQLLVANQESGTVALLCAQDGALLDEVAIPGAVCLTL